MIPFFVLDRPISLEILKDFFLKNIQYKFGILTHAFTSAQFKERFRNFPYTTPLRHSDLYENTFLNNHLYQNIIKVVDSGIFQAKRNISYESLFAIYEYLNADYGIMIDFLKDKQQTLKSAKKAFEIYQKGNYTFQLVGVAQGTSLQEYVECYQELQNIGFTHIALGGLLRRNGNSNYIKLASEFFLETLLDTINKKFSPKWIFTLGIYNPQRHTLLQKHNVWGADYKGWLFEYEEDYSFILEYLQDYKISDSNVETIKRVLQKFIFEKRMLRLQKKPDDRKKIQKKIKKIRQELDMILKQNDLSLQQFRFRRVRENLAKNIIQNPNCILTPSSHSPGRRGIFSSLELRQYQPQPFLSQWPTIGMGSMKPLLSSR